MRCRGACDPDVAATAFAVGVRPTIGGCKPCHDITLPPGALKAPGPQWWHPDHDGAAVTQLIERGFVAPDTPALITFLLKPLLVDDGGVPHKGGDWISADSEAYEGFVDFLTAAGPCVP